MIRANRYLCIDIGASTIKVGEFTIGRGGALVMTRFGYRTISVDPSQVERHSAVTSEDVREMLRERGIRRAPAMLSVPGQTVFTRFVKLPAVEETKVVQIIQYEAQQNVPFPMEEVVWDYQIISGSTDEELEVILAAIKTEIIDELTREVTGANLRVEMVDVAPLALYNAARYNYPEWFTPGSKECVMLLDIGARASNLVFVEGNKAFSRSIPIAGNTITQMIASEFQIPFEEAEPLKRQKGMVGLGGAYEEPADPVQASVAKIARNVMTQLHADVNRSINFYRTQRGGSAPTRLLLSGGSSIMGYMDRFFQDTLRLPVEYFNPFRGVQLGPQVSREELSQCAHFFGEVVGVALRRATECPIQVSVMPPRLLKAQAMRKKIPYFAAAGACIFLTLLCWSFYYASVALEVKGAAQRLEADVRNFKKNMEEINKRRRTVAENEAQLSKLTRLVDARTAWVKIFDELNAALDPDLQLWITALTPLQGTVAAAPRGEPPRGAATHPAQQTGGQSMPAIVGLDIEGRGVADLVNRGANLEKVEALVKRLSEGAGGVTGGPSIFRPGGATRVKFAQPKGGPDFEQFSFTFTIRIELREPLVL